MVTATMAFIPNGSSNHELSALASFFFGFEPIDFSLQNGAM